MLINKIQYIEIYAIEIEHDEYIKRIEAKQIEELFGNVYGRYGCYLNEEKCVLWDNYRRHVFNL